MFDDQVLKQIGNNMLEKHETLAVAESVTSGLIQAAFSTVPDASKFFHGGITAYNLGQKYRHLDIEPIHAQTCNCVSEKIAADMALNVCSMFHSDWGLGITGYAVPVPESGDKLFAYYAIACKGKVVKADKITAEKGEPLEVQLFYVNYLVSQLSGHTSLTT